MNGVAMYAATQERDYDDLVHRHAALVKRIAFHLMSRLPPSVQSDDLIQAGMIGLLEAARNYDASQGASFETYAGIRIRGAMLDEIRRTDWTPRSVHRKARQVAEAVRQIENEHGRDARDNEVADVLGIGLHEYHRILQDASGCRVFSFDDPASAGDEPDAATMGQSNEPLENLQHDAFRNALAEGIAGLPERERLVMALYYDEELNLREIGEVLGVSESRVCQIHGQALIRLRARMGEWVSEIEE
ncbi:MAG: RNA polymerase sigma factor FliA [Gammaproteobacteria bacterium]